MFTINDNLTSFRALTFFKGFRFGALLLINILLAKSILSQEELGLFEYFIFLTSALSTFWTIGATQTMLSEFKVHHSLLSESKSIFGNIYMLMISIAILIAICFFTIENLGFTNIFEGNSSQYLLPFLAYLFISSPTSLVEYIYLLNNKPYHIVYYGSISFTLQIVCIAVPVFLFPSLYSVIIGLIVSASIRHIWLWIVLINFKCFDLNIKYLKYFLFASSPLIFNAFIGGYDHFIDGFIVSAYFPKETFAVFTYGAKEFPLVIILTTSLSETLIPHFTKSEDLSERLTELKKKSNKLMKLLFPICAILMVLSYPLFPRVFNVNFSESASIFNIYLLIVISRVMFPHIITLGFRQNRNYLIISIFELIINVFFSFLFVNIFGLVGIAWGTVVAYTLHKVILIVYNKSKNNISPNEYIDFRMLTIYSTLLITVFFLVEFFSGINYS